MHTWKESVERHFLWVLTTCVFAEKSEKYQYFSAENKASYPELWLCLWSPLTQQWINTDNMIINQLLTPSQSEDTTTNWKTEKQKEKKTLVKARCTRPHVRAGTHRRNKVDSTLIQCLESTLFQHYLPAGNIETTSIQRLDVESTLCQDCVSAGMSYIRYKWSRKPLGFSHQLACLYFKYSSNYI